MQMDGENDIQSNNESPTIDFNAKSQVDQNELTGIVKNINKGKNLDLVNMNIQNKNFINEADLKRFRKIGPREVKRTMATLLKNNSRSIIP